MQIKTALYNADHLEYGIVTIPFPIPKDQYHSTIKMLEAFDIGEPRERDCTVREVLGPVPNLKCLEGTQINVDELDYLKGGRDAAKLANRTRYVATRPGVEVLPEEHGDQPATKKQQEYIRRLLRDFPDAQELLEYEDYQSNPTRKTASVFIQQVREDCVEAMSQRENYLDYVAHRPGVELQGEHGLWGPGGKVQNLSQAIREVAYHTGNVWTPVVAIRREDAERLGYDTAENWRALVNACLSDIAKGYKISPDHLR